MILAPTLTLSAGSGAAIVRPTFSRDFAGEKTLNNGTGPAITFTRASNATFFNANGVLRFAPHNAIRNSQALGATVGVIGSGGVAPTNWAVSGAGVNGVSVEISTGTEDGLAYVDFKFNGTATATSVVGINTESTTQVVAADGQTWTASGYVKLAAGSLSGIAHCRLFTTGRTSGGSTVAGQFTTTGFTPTSSKLSTQRVSGARTFSDAAVVRVSGNWEIGYTNGATIDFTLRIAAPQLERNASASEYIPTTGTANFDQPRFDHDPATAGNPSRGLLIEEARTNSIRNSQAGGSTNGVIGSGGVAPTNWVISPSANSVTSQIIGTGTEDGLAYIDIKVSGTPSSNGGVTIGFESTTQVVSSDTATWTVSAYLREVAGSTSNAVINIGVQGRTSAGASISGQDARVAVTISSAALKTQRQTTTLTMSNATVARAYPYALITYTSGNPIDLTLRIAAPQLEQGAFPTSYIPTTNAAATRSADSAVVTPISSFYNQSEGTFVAEASYTGKAPAVFTRIFSIGNTTAGDPDRWFWGFNNANTDHLVQHFTAGVFDYGVSFATSANTVYKVASAIALNNARSAQNGSLLGSDDTSVGAPSNKTHMVIGGSPTGTASAALHFRKIAYYPRRLSNTLLQQLTT